MADGVTLPLLYSLLFNRKVSGFKKRPATDSDKRHNLKAMLRSLEKHQNLLLPKEYAYRIVEKHTPTIITSTFPTQSVPPHVVQALKFLFEPLLAQTPSP